MSESISAANTSMQLKDYAKNAQREIFWLYMTVKEIRVFFVLENKQLYCHYKQEETLQEMYHKNRK